MAIQHLHHTGSVAVILGSAFSINPPRDLQLTPHRIMTPWGEVDVHQVSHPELNRPAYLLFRHGFPHQTYPQQLNFRAHAVALKILNCKALLVTSSVGVLDRSVPLDRPLLVHDLLMPDHRLPDGTLCSTLIEPPHALIPLTPDVSSALQPGHLVLRGPICAQELDSQMNTLVESVGGQLGPSVTFAYVAGPRTKTPAENHYWHTLGAQVNSMSVGPEVVLANELMIPTSALVVGHKYSNTHSSLAKASSRKGLEVTPGYNADHQEMSETLNRSHDMLDHIVTAFLCYAKPVKFPHYIYRYQS